MNKTIIKGMIMSAVALMISGSINAGGTVSVGSRGVNTTTLVTKNTYLSAYYAYNSAATTPSAVALRSELMGAQVATVICAMQKGISAVANSSAEHKMASFVDIDHVNLRNDKAQLQHNGNIYSLMLGFGYKFHEKIGAGLGFSGSYTDVKTAFNNGSVKEMNLGVHPYIYVQAHEKVRLDVMGGFTTGKSETKRNWKCELGYNGKIDVPVFPVNGTAWPVLNTTYTAKPGVTTMYGAFFVNLMHTVDKASIHFNVGYRAVQAKVKGFTETADFSDCASNAGKVTMPATTYKVQTVSGKLKLGYAWNESVSPFVVLMGGYDISEATKFVWADAYKNNATLSNTATEFKVARGKLGGGLGVDIKSSETLSGNLAATYMQSGKLGCFKTGANFTYRF